MRRGGAPHPRSGVDGLPVVLQRRAFSWSLPILHDSSRRVHRRLEASPTGLRHASQRVRVPGQEVLVIGASGGEDLRHADRHGVRRVSPACAARQTLARPLNFFEELGYLAAASIQPNSATWRAAAKRHPAPGGVRGPSSSSLEPAAALEDQVERDRGHQHQRQREWVADAPVQLRHAVEVHPVQRIAMKLSRCASYQPSALSQQQKADS